MTQELRATSRPSHFFHVKAVARQRGIDYEQLSEEERQLFLWSLLDEARPASDEDDP